MNFQNKECQNNGTNWESNPDTSGICFQNNGRTNHISESAPLCKECAPECVPTVLKAEEVSCIGEDVN